MQKLTPKDFFNHSGGAKGSDMAWDRIGRKYGFENHKHWRPEDLTDVSKEVSEQIFWDVRKAAEALGRPSNFRGIELVHRNWLQVHHSKANIYAVAPIVLPGYRDGQGYTNKTKKPIVSGGTGWAIEMAIQKQGSVFVFNTSKDLWYRWDYGLYWFCECTTPILTQFYAGIGSRITTSTGMEAIERVYKTTLQSLQKSDDGEDTNG